MFSVSTTDDRPNQNQRLRLQNRQLKKTCSLIAQYTNETLYRALTAEHRSHVLYRTCLGRVRNVEAVERPRHGTRQTPNQPTETTALFWYFNFLFGGDVVHRGRCATGWGELGLVGENPVQQHALLVGDLI